jgi:beta-lactamase regulating signal transducer with metallopeptidase domain
MIEQLNKIANDWWAWMWPMLWQVSLLVAIIGIIDFFLRKRIWPQLRYALWLLIMVKLILPPTFSLSTSITSLMQPVAQNVLTRLTGSSEFSSAINLEQDEAVEKPSFDTSAESVAVSQGNEEADVFALGDVITEDINSVKPSWQVYAMGVWIFGAAILAAWLVLRFRQLRCCHRGKVVLDNIPEWLAGLLSETAAS